MKLKKKNKTSNDLFSQLAPRRCVCNGFCAQGCIWGGDETTGNLAINQNREWVSDRYSIANTVSPMSL